ncbi:NnrU family protein [Rhizobium sp. A37_96]
MVQFLSAFSAFLLMHSLPAVPAVRGRLIRRFGRRAYLGLYSLVSIVLLAWLSHAALAIDYIPLWEPAPWQAWITLVAAPVGIFFVLAGLFSRNPLSISIRSGDGAGSVTAITRHPVLWGFSLWSAGHIVPNGDLRSLILFGGFTAFSLAGLFLLDRRARKRLGTDWKTAAAGTSVLPFVAILSGRAHFGIDGAMTSAALVAAALTAWLLGGGHGQLFGVEPLLLALSGFR